MDAIKVFDDPHRIELETQRNGERRFQTIGIINTIIVVLVVYIYREPRKRIVSARRASRKEREAYYGAR